MSKKAFKIQSQSPVLELDASRSAIAVFTVSNLTTRNVKGRCEIVTPSGAPEVVKEWVAFQSANEFTVATQSSSSVVVTIGAPPAQSPGDYQIQLLVYEVNDPEESSVMSEIVRFTLKPVNVVSPPPPPPPLPLPQPLRKLILPGAVVLACLCLLIGWMWLRGPTIHEATIVFDDQTMFSLDLSQSKPKKLGKREIHWDTDSELSRCHVVFVEPDKKDECQAVFPINLAVPAPPAVAPVPEAAFIPSFLLPIALISAQEAAAPAAAPLPVESAIYLPVLNGGAIDLRDNSPLQYVNFSNLRSELENTTIHNRLVRYKIRTRPMAGVGLAQGDKSTTPPSNCAVYDRDGILAGLLRLTEYQPESRSLSIEWRAIDPQERMQLTNRAVVTIRGNSKSYGNRTFVITMFVKRSDSRMEKQNGVIVNRINESEVPEMVAITLDSNGFVKHQIQLGEKVTLPGAKEPTVITGDIEYRLPDTLLNKPMPPSPGA